MILLLTSALAASSSCPDTDNAELAALVQTEEADAKDNTSVSASWSAKDEADDAKAAAKALKAKLKTVRKLSDDGGVCTDNDHYRASLVLMASSKPEDLKMAFDHAMKAATAGVPQGKWASMQSWDRLQLAEGREQSYGTQVHASGRCLFPVDDSPAAEENRKKWGAPTLTEIYTTYLKARGVDISPTTTSMLAHELLCPSK